jgi:hypothetical protein
MPQKPEQGNPGSQRHEQDPRWIAIKQFFINNPTFVLTMLYLYATAVGLVSSATLFQAFGINFFEFAEIGDFLLTAFRTTPTAFLDLVLTVFVTLGIYAALDVGMRGRIPSYYFWYALIAMFCVLVVQLGVTMFVSYRQAYWKAEGIKQGETPTVDVRYRSFSGSAGQITETDLRLIGTTQKVVCFYDVNGKRAIVIPQSQIVSVDIPEN